jgi:carboxyl-terminal processing protease
VTVTFQRPGVATPIKANLTRAVIHIPAVPYSLVFDNTVGYVVAQRFSESTAEEIAQAVKALEAKGAKGVILDLRGNPGGILEQAVATSNVFLKRGQDVLSQRGRQGESQVYVATEQPVAPNVPLVVMIDGGSASASEIVAGALQDHDRAVVVGTTSFGKGLVQTLFPLDGGYALKLTTAKYYLPSGRSIHKERKLQADGQFVEVHPDSVETDSARKARPVFRSDAGRVVYGGGAVTPDVVVKRDTLTTAEQALAKSLAPKIPEIFGALSELAFEKKGQVRPDFVVAPQWREDLFQRITKAGVKVDRALWDAGGAWIDRAIEQRVARVAFGDSTARRRDLKDDPQLQRAIDLLKRGATQRDCSPSRARTRPRSRRRRWGRRASAPRRRPRGRRPPPGVRPAPRGAGREPRGCRASSSPGSPALVVDLRRLRSARVPPLRSTALVRLPRPAAGLLAGLLAAARPPARHPRPRAPPPRVGRRGAGAAAGRPGGAPPGQRPAAHLRRRERRGVLQPRRPVAHLPEHARRARLRPAVRGQRRRHRARARERRAGQDHVRVVPAGRPAALLRQHLARRRRLPAPPRPVEGYVWGIDAFDLYTAGRDGSGMRRLTSYGVYTAEGVLSPDGRRIVFTSLKDGDLDIYTMNVDGTDVRRLTTTPGYDGGPWWSPDGTKIVYRAWHYAPDDTAGLRAYRDLLAQRMIRPNRMELFVMNADGSDQRQITRLGGANFGPSWTPDGRRIIFSSNHTSPRSRNFDLYLVNLDGTGLVQVTTDPEFDGFPMFSPDGTKLVWASNRGAAGPARRTCSSRLARVGRAAATRRGAAAAVRHGAATAGPRGDGGAAAQAVAGAAFTGATRAAARRAGGLAGGLPGAAGAAPMPPCLPTALRTCAPPSASPRCSPPPPPPRPRARRAGRRSPRPTAAAATPTPRATGTTAATTTSRARCATWGRCSRARRARAARSSRTAGSRSTCCRSPTRACCRARPGTPWASRSRPACGSSTSSAAWPAPRAVADRVGDPRPRDRRRDADRRGDAHRGGAQRVRPVHRLVEPGRRRPAPLLQRHDRGRARVDGAAARRLHRRGQRGRRGHLDAGRRRRVLRGHGGQRLRRGPERAVRGRRPREHARQPLGPRLQRLRAPRVGRARAVHVRADGGRPRRRVGAARRRRGARG